MAQGALRALYQTGTAQPIPGYQTGAAQAKPVGHVDIGEIDAGIGRIKAILDKYRPGTSVHRRAMGVLNQLERQKAEALQQDVDIEQGSQLDEEQLGMQKREGILKRYQRVPPPEEE